jgi:hypothetical protein
LQKEGLLEMGQPLDPATRPSRLAWTTHIAVALLLSLSFLSGLGVWRGQSLQASTLAPPSWLHPLRVLHGCLNPFQCVLFGFLCCHHIRIGWQLRANLFSGFFMEFIFAGLILSGAGLYYAGSVEWQNTCIWAHRVLGLLAPVGLAAHWAAGTRWAKKVQNNLALETDSQYKAPR